MGSIDDSSRGMHLLRALKVLEAAQRRKTHSFSFDDENSEEGRRRRKGAEGSRNGSSPREHATE